ncbi:MFS transporter, partial [Mycolicibacterium hippocampi]|uniref:MFS transporter n=1 Tax=Mycolicibacterium hippocampi TaxID=659824 RepID=UPI0033905EB0
MTALKDAERVTSVNDLSRFYPAWLPSYRFVAAVIAIGGMQLMATMDSTVAIVALPRNRHRRDAVDGHHSWVITAYVLTFGGLMLLGGRLGDTIGRKRTFIVGVSLFTIASAPGRHHRTQTHLHRRGVAVHDRLG